VLAYAVASLLVVRPLAVALALLGSRVHWSTVGFISWAGPRGLASIVYAVLIAESGIPAADEVFQVAACTILLSIYLHGLTAAPLSRRYASPSRAPTADDPSTLGWATCRSSCRRGRATTSETGNPAGAHEGPATTGHPRGSCRGCAGRIAGRVGADGPGSRGA
jgi:hypothetical protein